MTSSGSAGRPLALPAFELRGAGVTYAGRAVLSGVDLTVEPGETVAVLGPSGAGKTTLLRLLNRTVRPDTGSVHCHGVDLAQLAPRDLARARAEVGFVHQDPSLVPNLRASQNVIAGKLGQRGFLSGLRSMFWPARAELEQAHALFERVGIPEKLFERTDTLSGGERQRVALARALFQEPRALVCDEPVASVDQARGRDLIALLMDVARERGLTLVVSMHDLDLARALPRTVAMRGGRVEFDLATADVSREDLAGLFRFEGADRVG